MARRYCGDITMTLSLVRMKGDNGKVGDFYKGSVSGGGHHGNGMLLPRECGLWPWADKRSPEAYDRVAKAFLALATLHAPKVRKSFAYDDDGTVEILRVQKAPCPCS